MINKLLFAIVYLYSSNILFANTKNFKVNGYIEWSEVKDINYTNINTNSSIEDIARQLYNLRDKKDIVLVLPEKPQKDTYIKVKKLVKDEFETTKLFKKRLEKERHRVSETNSNIDKEYQKSIQKWNKIKNEVKETYSKKIYEYKKEFEKNTNNYYLKCLQKALFIKYGQPLIKEVKYNADKEFFRIRLVSGKDKVINYDLFLLEEQSYVFDKPTVKSKKRSILKGTYKINIVQGMWVKIQQGWLNIGTIYEYDFLSSDKQKYTYDRIISLPLSIKYAKKFKKILTNKEFKPTVEFEVVNNKLKFSGIKEIKEPKLLIVDNEYRQVYNSISGLKRFIKKHNKIKQYEQKAQARIHTLEVEKENKIKGEYKYALTSYINAKSFVRNYPYHKLTRKIKKILPKLKKEYDDEQARIRAEEKRAYERKMAPFWRKKQIGERVCEYSSYEGSSGFAFAFSNRYKLCGTVENRSGSRIQIRIDKAVGIRRYNGTSIYNGKLVWSQNDSWK